MKSSHRSAFNSRQYMLSKDYELFYYSDLHFQSVGMHSHDYYEFYFFQEGRFAMEIDGQIHELKTGDLIVVPPGTPHQALVRDGSVPYRRFVLWLSRDYCHALAEEASAYRPLMQRALEWHSYVTPFDRVEFNLIEGKLTGLLDELRGDRFGREERISLGIRDLLLHLNRSVYERQSRSRQHNLSSLETVIAYIDRHLDEDLSLDRLSQACFLSKYYISHLFQEETGVSVHRTITRRRLAACCDAMRSGMGIHRAAMSVGFRDYSSFYRAFRREYGVPPSAFEGLER